MIITEARLKQIIKEEIQKRYAEIDDVLLERLIEESKLMQAIAASGLSLLLALQVIVSKDNKDFQDRMLAQTEAAAESKSDRMLADMEKNTKNPIAWAWSDDEKVDTKTFDPSQLATGERFPLLSYDDANQSLKNVTVTMDDSYGVEKGAETTNPENFIVLPPSWSIANKVVKDKKMGKPNIPGMDAGEHPPLTKIIKVLTKVGQGKPGGELEAPKMDRTKFIEEYGDYLTTTGDLGSNLSSVKGYNDFKKFQGEPGSAASKSKLPVMQPTVSIDDNFLDANPDLVLFDANKSVQDKYIELYYGQLLDGDDIKEIYGDLIEDKE